MAGDAAEARYWAYRLTRDCDGSSGDGRPVVLVEEGRRGNFLGTLVSYGSSRELLPAGQAVESSVDQIVMLLGAGTRLSPFTQALRNIKAAFPLPDLSSPQCWTTVGEAAIRAGAPLVDHLRTGGFRGVVVRWGDEIVIPGSDLVDDPAAFKDLDAVRFGCRAAPTPELANQKEWLLQDRASGLVVGELSRQPLDRLRAEVAASDSAALSTFVNLGSFAMSEQFLQALRTSFGSYLGRLDVSANWDPYFWMAFHCEDAESWRARVEREDRAGAAGLRALLAAIPEFFDLVCQARRNLAGHVGRAPRVGLLDFGDPYWIDIGSHAGLSTVLDDVFEASADGAVARAFFGLPDSLAAGESVVAGSVLPKTMSLAGSLVLGCRIRDDNSKIRRAVVIGGDYGHLTIEPGGGAFHSRCERLRLAGAGSFAFRYAADSGSVDVGERLSAVPTPDGFLTLRYRDSLGTLDESFVSRPVVDNPISFREASALVVGSDPIDLERYWAPSFSKANVSH